MVLLFIQFGVAFTILLFSAFIIFFAGRSFSLDKGDWQPSIPLSHLFYGQSQSGHEASQLSSMVYIFKFQPLFLVSLTLSALYLLLLIGYVFLRKRSKWLTFYQAILGIGLLALSYLPNIQYVFSRVVLAGGLLYILLAQLSYLDVFND